MELDNITYNIEATGRQEDKNAKNRNPLSNTPTSFRARFIYVSIFDFETPFALINLTQNLKFLHNSKYLIIFIKISAKIFTSWSFHFLEIHIIQEKFVKAVRKTMYG